MTYPSPFKHLLFSVEIIFSIGTFQFSNRCFFLLLKMPMTRKVEVGRVQVERVGVLYNAYVGCHHGSGAGTGLFKPRYRPFFTSLWLHVNRFSIFISRSSGFFNKILGFSDKWAFFSKNTSFST